MSTDLTRHETQPLALSEQWKFAEAVSKSGILPRAYKEDPGAVLVAVNLGQSMGLSPSESLYRIHVIEGKPSASAELIASNVRRAGHRLRIQGDDQRAVVQIVRSDDPNFAYEVTWTIEKARAAGLTGKGVWKSYPSAMLKARAITECARSACPEALYGVTYTVEEVESLPRETSTPARSAAAVDDLTAPVEEVVLDAEPDAGEAEPMTPRTRGQLFALLAQKGIADEEVQRAGMSKILGRPVESRGSLTEDEARTVILELQDRPDADEDGGS